MAPPVFDYSNGSAVIQDGVIYYSPNCTRPVVIPSRPVYSAPNPFRQPRLNASMFRQPVWWSQGWAWQSFISLAPSFVFTPFESLCAMPRIEEVTFSFDGLSGEMRETRYRPLPIADTVPQHLLTYFCVHQCPIQLLCCSYLILHKHDRTWHVVLRKTRPVKHHIYQCIQKLDHLTLPHD